LYSENTGSCRFHRKWVEDLIDEIILSHFELDYDFWATNFQLAKAIHDYQAAAGVFWESERVVDIIQGFVEKWVRDGLKESELLGWALRFRQDKWKAAREFWQEMYDGMAEAFAAGMKEPVPAK
jgi:glyceraldehyde-3-phosphate dehydrogenase (ferredoxin)